MDKYFAVTSRIFPVCLTVFLAWANPIVASPIELNSNDFSIQANDYGSLRDHAKLQAFLTGKTAPYRIFIWANVNNLGEFCFSTTSGWTRSIPDLAGGSMTNGTAHCQDTPIEYFNTTSSFQVSILDDMNLTDPVFNGARVYAGIGYSNNLQPDEYKVIYSVATPAVRLYNKAPTAVANFQYNNDAPAHVKLDATESSDSDGAGLNYEWAISEAGSNQPFLYLYGVKQQVMLEKPTRYHISLTVTDADGASSTVSSEINIEEQSIIWLYNTQ